MKKENKLEITKNVEIFWDIYGDVLLYPEHSTVLESAIFIANIEMLDNAENKLEMQVLKCNIKGFFSELYGDKISPFLYALCKYKHSKYEDLFKEPDKDINIAEYIIIHFKDIAKMDFSPKEKFDYLKNIIDYFKDRNVIPKEAIAIFNKIKIDRYYSFFMDNVKIVATWFLPVVTYFYAQSIINIHVFFMFCLFLLSIISFIVTIQWSNDLRPIKKYGSVFVSFLVIIFFVLSALDVVGIRNGNLEGKVEKVYTQNIVGLYPVEIKENIETFDGTKECINTYYSVYPYLYNENITAYKCFLPFVITGL